MISVTGIECLRCHHILVSRARHDMHSCPCGAVHVDGGRDYLRIMGDLEKYRAVRIDLPLDDVRDLARDWQGRNKHGTYPPETHVFLNVRTPTAEETDHP